LVAAARSSFGSVGLGRAVEDARAKAWGENVVVRRSGSSEHTRWTARVFLGLGLAVGILSGCARPKLEVMYFYMATCPACEESRKSLSGAAAVRIYSQQYRDPVVRVYDLLEDVDASGALAAAMGTYRIPAEELRLPLLIVNGTVFLGLEEIRPAIAALDRRKR